jgi:hypothetical protein
MTAPELGALMRGLAPALRDYVTSALASLNDRLTAIETHDLPRGDPGAVGPAGPAGTDGKDGAPGLGFDDLDVVFDETRGYLLRWQRGAQVKERALPITFDAGVWQAGRGYPKGAGTTVKGAWWIAQKDTTDRPGDSRDWRLAVKGGRDGKDGKNGKDGE